MHCHRNSDAFQRGGRLGVHHERLPRLEEFEVVACLRGIALGHGEDGHRRQAGHPVFRLGAGFGLGRSGGTEVLQRVAIQAGRLVGDDGEPAAAVEDVLIAQRGSSVGGGEQPAAKGILASVITRLQGFGLPPLPATDCANAFHGLHGHGVPLDLAAQEGAGLVRRHLAAGHRFPPFPQVFRDCRSVPTCGCGYPRDLGMNSFAIITDTQLLRAILLNFFDGRDTLRLDRSDVRKIAILEVRLPWQQQTACGCSDPPERSLSYLIL